MTGKRMLAESTSDMKALRNLSWTCVPPLFAVVAIVAGVLMSETLAAQEKSWQPLAPMPGERFEHACALVGDTLYVFGGYREGVKTSNHVQAFDLAMNRWRRLQEMPSAVTHLNTVVDGRSVWIAGGFKDGYPGKPIDEVWKYDVDKDTFVAAPSCTTVALS